MQNITNERRMKLIFRWAIVAGVPIALFWTTWYFIAGSVPMVKIEGFPFAISRWWDVPMGPVWSTLLIMVISITDDYPMDLWSFCIIGMFTGLFCGLLAGLAFGLVFGMVIGLGIGLCIVGVVLILYGLVILTRAIKIIGVRSKGIRKRWGDWLLAKENTNAPAA